MNTEKNKLLENEIGFIGSAKFMASFLNKLVKNLADSWKDKFKETKNIKFSSLGRTFLSRKRLYPYDDTDNIKEFVEKKTSRKGRILFKLNDFSISDKYYEHRSKYLERI